MDVSLNLFIIQPNSASTGAENAPFRTAITQLHLIFLLWYVSNLSIFQDSEACPSLVPSLIIFFGSAHDHNQCLRPSILHISQTDTDLL